MCVCKTSNIHLQQILFFISAEAPKAKSAAASTVPREEALQRLQEAYTVLRQTKQGNGLRLRVAVRRCVY